MIKFITRFVFTVFAVLLSASTVLAQNSNLYVIDSFGDHTMPGWYSGGDLSMKYSHKEDNLENGYGVISSSTKQITPNSFAGLIRKEEKLQVAENNILSVMLQGINNDMTVTIQVLFDKNNDGKYDEATDARLESKPFSMNFSGWKEAHFNINQSEFKIVSKSKDDDFSILEQEALGIQFSFQTGKEFTTSPVETGVAMISERYSKELKQETAQTDMNNGESYFTARNYPNPFNPETKINYILKNSTSVKITVYDRLGREVVVLVDENQSEGEHSVTFNASNLPSGVYFYRIKTPEMVEVQKMVFTK
ncbi:MAG TPA: T9SS type A sorting domain-containing protein [Ignavibacteria bacterium]|nr:T9SS type A sorting domain-containing protein [Ignavibacteria bacterium]